MADFFKQDEPTVQPEETTPAETPQTIRLGDKEYTQEELADKVGLADQVRDFEQKWNTKIDRLMPAYTQTTQKLSEFERREQEREQASLAKKQETGEQLSTEEIRRQAALQLKDLMRDPEVQAELRQTYMENQQARELIQDSEYVINDYAGRGLPQVSVDDLLTHMATTGIKNPEKAYKDMFEPEIDAWKESQLGKLRQPGLTTISQSSAGGKNPAAVLPTKANLKQLLHEAITGGGE